MSDYNRQMTQTEQQLAYSTELENLTNRYIDECDMTYESLVGCLECYKSFLLYCKHRHDEEEDNE